MPSRAILAAILSLGLLVPGSACAWLCAASEPAPAPLAKLAGDAPMPCHGEPVSQAPDPSEPGEPGCHDGCPLCEGTWISPAGGASASGALASAHASAPSAALSYLAQHPRPDVAPGFRMDRSPPLRLPRRSSVFRL